MPGCAFGPKAKYVLAMFVQDMAQEEADAVAALMAAASGDMRSNAGTANDEDAPSGVRDADMV
jgi:hypothetical protein